MASLKRIALIAPFVLAHPPTNIIGFDGGLAAVMDKLEDVPENYRELYTAKNGKFELTGIRGVKTEADVLRVQTALTKERDEHKATKERLTAWGDLDHDEVMSKLDRIPELEAAAKGKLDEAAIEEIVSKRVDGTINSRIKPLERSLEKITKERDDAIKARDELYSEKRTRVIQDDLRAAMVEAKVIPEAQEDILLLADRIFELAEDGKTVQTKDGGSSAKDWLAEMQPKRSHWWPAASGNGGRGGAGGGASLANNPWSGDAWSLTKQGEIIRTQGREKADQMAKAAGSFIGATSPPKPKK